MINLVKVISTEIAKARRIIKVLRLGKSDVQTAHQVSPFGTDSNPIPNLRAIYMKSGTKGDTFVVGYINVQQIMDTGEHRIFSTDEDGNLSIDIRLRNDGTMEIGGDDDNMVRFSKLKDAYDQLKSDFDTHVAIYNTHIHPFIGLAAGVPGFTTSPTTTDSASIGDISGAKIDNIKTST